MTFRLSVPVPDRRTLWHGLPFAILLLLSACSSGSKKSGPSVYPTGLPLLAVSEERGESTEFWLINPRNPTQRWKFATISHRQDWGVRASVSPDGKTLVYAALPKTTPDPNTQSELWALPISGRNARRLANGIDLRSGLVWSPDSSWVSYDRQSGNESQLRRVHAGGAGDQLLSKSTADSRWYAAGYLPDGGAAVLAHLTAAGTELVSQPIGGVPTKGAQVSPSASRDFTVSSEGRPAMLVLQTENGRKVYRAVAQEPDGSFSRLTGGGQEDTGIVFDPRTGAASVGVVPSAPGERVLGAAGAGIVQASSGFDVPMGWSPDSAYLAVRHFSGRTTDQPGNETLILLRPNGERTEIKADAAQGFIGWMLPGR